MIKSFKGITPRCHPASYITENVTLIGDVHLDEFSSVWYGSVLRGDIQSISIGPYSNIQDGSILHVTDKDPVRVGAYVTVGHRAILHGCTIEDFCLIGMGAIVLNRAIIGKGSIVAAGAVIPEGMVVPPFSLVVGVPAVIKKSLKEDISSAKAQAVKYKTLWTKEYGIMPDAGGEEYQGEKII